MIEEINQIYVYFIDVLSKKQYIFWKHIFVNFLIILKLNDSTTAISEYI